MNPHEIILKLLHNFIIQISFKICPWSRRKTSNILVSNKISINWNFSVFQINLPKTIHESRWNKNTLFALKQLLNEKQKENKLLSRCRTGGCGFVTRSVVETFIVSISGFNFIGNAWRSTNFNSYLDNASERCSHSFTKLILLTFYILLDQDVYVIDNRMWKLLTR